MKVGVRYLVTKDSDDGTFLDGDHIWLYQDGTIGCREARGWIDEEDVKQAIKGMEYEVDKEWYKERKLKLKEELNKLKEYV